MSFAAWIWQWVLALFTNHYSSRAFKPLNKRIADCIISELYNDINVLSTSGLARIVLASEANFSAWLRDIEMLLQIQKASITTFTADSTIKRLFGLDNSVVSLVIKRNCQPPSSYNATTHLVAVFTHGLAYVNRPANQAWLL